jgi:putative pantetheine hydrolase
VIRTGPTNGLTDVRGLRVGHSTRIGDGWLSGVTVVLAPEGGAVAGVDVRGGGPGTRETDVLDPRNGVDRVHAIVLAGGSAFGLSAACGVTERLAADKVGFPVGPEPGEVVPIVPAAVVFDLGRGGRFEARPDAALGAEAYEAALAGAGPVPQGVVGAGTGAVAGGLKGGVGTASAVLEDGTVVAALAVVNAAGSTVDTNTGEQPAPDPSGLHDLLGAAGACFGRAVAHAMLAATSVTGAEVPGRAWRSYREAFPSAFAP